MIKDIEEMVYRACYDEKNPFGSGAWETHILPVVKYARKMAKILNADEEIVVIAAYLHDYANIAKIGNEADHHINGANEARKLLTEKGYDSVKTDLVCDAIYAHRASVKIPRKSKEEECVASADAMAHIEQMVALLHRVYFRDELALKTGAKYVLDKLERSFQKMHPSAQEMMLEKYSAARLVLEAVLPSERSE